MKEKWREIFRNPGAEFRSFPFWGWNGKLDKEELVRQVRDIKDKGMGGFFIHSRDGLETPYLEEEWMDCVKIVVKEAKKLGLYAWLYDEDRWPSGTAGGRVTAKGDEYRCKGLTLEVLEKEKYSKIYLEEIAGRTEFDDCQNGVLTAYAARIKDDSILSFRRIEMKENESFDEGEKLLIVRIQVSAPSEWFNNETPPDNLNPECVRRFIEETHEKYKEAVGEEFGSTIPGIFTDEPSLHDNHASFGKERSWIPWTYGYGAYFTELVGYDFLDVAPFFFFDGEKSSKTRHDYWCSVTKRYGESYFKQIGEWCEKNHLLFTGHFLWENHVGIATRVNGAVMPHYQYMHVPGIDLLCEQTNEYLTAKQCTSVANQLGKKQVISETYGCTGWDFTFEGQKWVGDWQYVLGVNRRCQHLTLYSLRGCRKRDYPPSFNYNTNWWKENSLVEDYFARASVVLEQGKAIRKILMLHPASTLWSKLGTSPYGNSSRNHERDFPKLLMVGEQFSHLVEHLLRMHLDCDLGDELLIQQYGKTESGMFQIGEATYEAVVMPPMDTILLSTAQLLLEYMEQGGKIFGLQPFPQKIGGDTDAEKVYDRLFSHTNFIPVKDERELSEKLNFYRTIHLDNGNGEECRDLLYQLRESQDGYFLFVVNNNREKGISTKISLPFNGKVEELDLLNGKVKEIAECQNTRKGLSFGTYFSASGSKAYFIKPLALVNKVYRTEFSYKLDRPNVLPLDMCSYRLNNEEFSETMEIWKAQYELRERLGMMRIYRNGREQRYKWIGRPHAMDGTKAEFVFRFESLCAMKNVSLAIERVDEFEVFFNGKLVEKIRDGWILDREFETIKLPEISRGQNEVRLVCEYKNHMELENIYLVGSFGVDEKRRMHILPETLDAGDWGKQGLFHYCGGVTYFMEYDWNGEILPVMLKMDGIQAVTAAVEVNENRIILPWDYSREVDISAYLRKGKNRIAVEINGSPRNMMGPFHVKEKPYNTNDMSFTPEKEEYQESYLTVPYGITGNVEIFYFK